jgi:hypothetical protein
LDVLDARTPRTYKKFSRIPAALSRLDVLDGRKRDL